MAVPTEIPVVTPSAHVVGTAFVDLYYKALHKTPELVYRFYQDSSVLTRPDTNGTMISVTTMDSINEMILSLNYENWKAEIKSVDSQVSYKNGVMVLVTGCLTAKDSLQRKFAQSFFLAPQDNGYFVLNDAFRYVEENEALHSDQINTAESAGPVSLSRDLEMVVPTKTPVFTPSAHVVGTAFVDQYYNILHKTPKSVYRFYKDASVLTRPDTDGTMISVTTMDSINEMILSLNYENWKAEIKSVDSQESYKNGVMVLATGCLTKKDSLQRKFAQSFFLAPQDNGYFVLNDAFRYVEENEALQSDQTNAAESVGSVSLSTDIEPNHVAEEPVVETADVPVPVNGSIDNGEDGYNPRENEEGPVADVEVVAASVAPSSKNEAQSSSYSEGNPLGLTLQCA